MFQKKQSILVLFCCLAILATSRQFRTLQSTPSLLDPTILQSQMFQREITGRVEVFSPTNLQRDALGKIISEEYHIQMIRTTQQILPSSMFGETTIYAYGGTVGAGQQYAGFPGPAIVATKDRLTKVTWTNNIPGPHILPVDLNHPFESTPAFQFEVPAVPHAHGIATTATSDGLPQAYWTSSGFHGPFYATQQPTAPKSAVFYYPNQQEAGNYMYHDHAYGITRLNVYSGLAGLYKIVDPASKQEKLIIDKYGDSVTLNDTKFLVITDKSFTTEGQLFYGGQVENPNFSSWVPEFFGNTMQVNGVLWPKMTLTKGIYRFVLLNACTSRFLNIWFDNAGQKVPFDLIRVDGSFYSSPVTKTQFLATISSRIEFILDLTRVQGEVILRNNAPAPYPMGNPQNFDSRFTGQIMKFIVQGGLVNLQKNKVKSVISTSVASSQNAVVKYPKFLKGEKVFMTLFEVKNTAGAVEAAFIDGLSMMTSADCPNSTFDSGKTYDFYFINLTPDTHPMHIHLINFQKVKQFLFNSTTYARQYFLINGGIPNRYGFMTPPITLDPEPFRTGPDQLPGEQEKVFRDTVEAHAGYVTVLRVKFARNDGKPFRSFDTSGQRYVLHCHILQHQDNEMMKYFCLR